MKARAANLLAREMGEKMDKLAAWARRARERFTELREEHGQGLVEYGLILVLVSVVAVVALTDVGNSVTSILAKVASDL
jgi:pilus assembly protein Flp/PilA